VNHDPSRRDNEFAVFISLAVALGMLIGAIAAVWMGTIAADNRGTVVSVDSSEVP